MRKKVRNVWPPYGFIAECTCSHMRWACPPPSSHRRFTRYTSAPHATNNHHHIDNHPTRHPWEPGLHVTSMILSLCLMPCVALWWCKDGACAVLSLAMRHPPMPLPTPLQTLPPPPPPSLPLPWQLRRALRRPSRRRPQPPLALPSCSPSPLPTWPLLPPALLQPEPLVP